jgi:hypothetical protein
MARKLLTDFSESNHPTIIIPPLPTEAQIQQMLQDKRERDELVRREQARSKISSKPVGFVADITGRRSGRLTAKQFVRIDTSTRHMHQLWLCKCTCGNTRIVSNIALLSGNIRSCESCANRDRERGLKRQYWERRQARVRARQARTTTHG